MKHGTFWLFKPDHLGCHQGTEVKGSERLLSKKKIKRMKQKKIPSGKFHPPSGVTQDIGEKISFIFNTIDNT